MNRIAKVYLVNAAQSKREFLICNGLMVNGFDDVNIYSNTSLVNDTLDELNIQMDETSTLSVKPGQPVPFFAQLILSYNNPSFTGYILPVCGLYLENIASL